MPVNDGLSIASSTRIGRVVAEVCPIECSIANEFSFHSHGPVQQQASTLCALVQKPYTSDGHDGLRHLM